MFGVSDSAINWGDARGATLRGQLKEILMRREATREISEAQRALDCAADKFSPEGTVEKSEQSSAVLSGLPLSQIN